jgi:16S rRNA (cytidine1402-2'-O)-methyltransferase
LDALAAAASTQVLFEAPHRIEALAVALADTCAARTVTVCRELTKQFETVARMPAAELPAWFAADPNRSRGEFRARDSCAIGGCRARRTVTLHSMRR